MTSLDERLDQSVQFIRQHTPQHPSIGIILGSGLGDFGEMLPNPTAISCSNIPHYPVSQVAGHKSQMVLSSFQGKELVVLQGRVHFYESGSVGKVLYPIRVLHHLGVKTLIITNAAGGVNRTFRPGDLMVITDIINLTFELIGVEKPARTTPSPFSDRLIASVMRVAQEGALRLQQGTYVGVKGPTYETAAEVEMVRLIGGDAVGMSTVLEASLASNLGMEVLGISCITNMGSGISEGKLDHSEVIKVGDAIKQDFTRLLLSVIRTI